MIHFFFENIKEKKLDDNIKSWIEKIIITENKQIGKINFIFCDDEYLLKINQDFLNHDYYTDIITFNYVKGKTISGDIFISLERIKENALTLKKDYHQEFYRVMAHGILHLCGYNDKTKTEIKIMREKEDFYIEKVNITF